MKKVISEGCVLLPAVAKAASVVIFVCYLSDRFSRIVMKIISLTIFVAVVLAAMLVGLGIYAYGNPDSFAAAIENFVSAPLFGPTIWVSDLAGVELQNSLLYQLLAGSLIWAMLLINAVLVKKTRSTQKKLQAKKIVIVSVGAISLGTVYMNVRDHLICVPEVANDILGATSEEAALNNFRNSFGDVADVVIEAGPPSDDPDDFRFDDFVPSVRHYIVSSHNRGVKMAIGVVPIDEHPRCSGWSLAYDKTDKFGG